MAHMSGKVAVCLSGDRVCLRAPCGCAWSQVNKHNENFVANQGTSDDDASKWTLEQLANHLNSEVCAGAGAPAPACLHHAMLMFMFQ